MNANSKIQKLNNLRHWAANKNIFEYELRSKGQFKEIKSSFSNRKDGYNLYIETNKLSV